MPVINRIAEFEAELRAWRRHLHTIPELDFDLHDTAAFVAARLREIGVDEIHEGIARTGIVALIHGQAPGPVVGLRADMDALPIAEATGAPHASTRPGRMHACGHDGHTTILLGAARYLAETRRFAGTVALIFQPSEEMSGGGRVMVDEGMMERFAVARVFALHNDPALPLGTIASRPGPVAAAADDYVITLRGMGGHAAYPHLACDPVAPAIQIAAGLPMIARTCDPLEPAVVAVTMLRGADAGNVIPETAMVGGTVRTLDAGVRTRMAEAIGRFAEATAAAHGVTAEIAYRFGYPVMVNDAAQTAFALGVAEGVVGAARVRPNEPPGMGAEDFGYMLQARPGAYVMLGTGGGPPLHSPAFDYNDDATPIGASYFARLVETALPLDGAGV